MPILNALQMQNQCYLDVRSKCILNALRIRKGSVYFPNNKFSLNIIVR